MVDADSLRERIRLVIVSSSVLFFYCTLVSRLDIIILILLPFIVVAVCKALVRVGSKWVAIALIILSLPSLLTDYWVVIFPIFSIVLFDTYLLERWKSSTDVILATYVYMASIVLSYFAAIPFLSGLHDVYFSPPPIYIKVVGILILHSCLCLLFYATPVAVLKRVKALSQVINIPLAMIVSSILSSAAWVFMYYNTMEFGIEFLPISIAGTLTLYYFTYKIIFRDKPS